MVNPRLTVLAVVVLAAALFVPASTATAADAPCWPDAATDLDGGGPDVAVGLPSYDLPGKADAGAVVVWSNVGHTDFVTPQAPTASRIYTADDFTGLHAQAGARFGAAVSVIQDWGAGDDADDCSDLVVGAPGQDVGAHAGAGAVYELAGAVGGLATVKASLTEDSIGDSGGAQAGAEFGAAIAVETQAELAIGAPGRTVGSVVDAGRVVRIDGYGTAGQDAPVVIEQGGLAPGAAETGDRFGEQLRTMAHTGGVDIVVGVPHEDVGAEKDAGSVYLLPAQGDASSASQNIAGAGGTAEAGDRYGASIDTFWSTNVNGDGLGNIVAGVPGEDVGSKTNAGAVSLSVFAASTGGSSGRLLGRAEVVTQDSPRVKGAAESGDGFGSAVVVGDFEPSGSLWDLAVGTPGEDVGSIADAGLVSDNYIVGRGVVRHTTQPGTWTQGSAAVDGAAEKGDAFGSQLSSVYLEANDDNDPNIWAMLVVTVPGEDLSDVKDAGMAYVGYAPGAISVPLVPPVRQAGAGLGMAPMHVGTQ